MDDKKALRAVKSGDRDALGWIIDRYAPYVSAVIQGIIGRSMTQCDIEEVASDVFFALWKNAHKANPKKLKAYLGSIARNMAKNKHREFRGDLHIEDDELILIAESSPENDYLAKEQKSSVQRAILSMKHPDREIFIRHYYYYQNVSAIADETNMNVSTVKTRLARGREKLRLALSQGG